MQTQALFGSSSMAVRSEGQVAEKHDHKYDRRRKHGVVHRYTNHEQSCDVHLQMCLVLNAAHATYVCTVLDHRVIPRMNE